MSDLDKNAKLEEIETPMVLEFGDATFGDKEMSVFVTSEGLFTSSEKIQNLHEILVKNGYDLSNGAVYIVLPDDDYIKIYNESENNKKENNESEEINND